MTRELKETTVKQDKKVKEVAQETPALKVPSVSLVLRWEGLTNWILTEL